MTVLISADSGLYFLIVSARCLMLSMEQSSFTLCTASAMIWLEMLTKYSFIMKSQSLQATIILLYLQSHGLGQGLLLILFNHHGHPQPGRNRLNKGIMNFSFILRPGDVCPLNIQIRSGSSYCELHILSLLKLNNVKNIKRNLSCSVFTDVSIVEFRRLKRVIYCYS